MSIQSMGNPSFTAVIDTLKANIMLCDADFEVTFVNQAMRKFLNSYQKECLEICKDADTILGKSLELFFIHHSICKEKLRTEIDLPHKITIMMGERIFSLTFSATSDVNNDYAGNCIEWRDITTLYHDLNHSAQLRSVLDGLSVPTLILGLDFKPSYLNPAMEQLIEKHEQHFKPSFSDSNSGSAINIDVLAAFNLPESLWRILEDPDQRAFSTMQKISDRYFEMNVTPIRNAGGKISGANIEWIDRTNLQEARIYSSVLFDLINHSSSNFIICDTDMNIAYANSRTETFLSSNENDVEGFLQKLKNEVKIFQSSITHLLIVKENTQHEDVAFTRVVSHGNQEVHINITPLRNEHGVHVGNGIEWRENVVPSVVAV